MKNERVREGESEMRNNRTNCGRKREDRLAKVHKYVEKDKERNEG